MKLGTLLFFCVLVVQKEAVRADQSEENPDDSDFPNGTNSESNSGQSGSFIQFSGDLYQAVKESQPSNFILSPLSVRSALAMLSLGATGETAEEMQKVLQLPADASDLIKSQSNLTSSLKRISSSQLGLKLATGDAVFTNSRIRIYKQFKDNVARLGGETDRVNFGAGFPAARKINDWVRSKTEGKIDKIVEPSDLNDQISLLVLNTIYFKGSWKHEFNVSETTQSPFFINESCSMNVEMMTQKHEFQHADLEDAKAQILILPYQGKRLSMMIYVPWRKEEGALDILENWLSTKSPFEIQREHLNENQLSTVFVSLPKFKIQSSLQLNEPLKTLGLGKMFDAVTANFSGIFNDSRNFFVSKVSQQTFIEVNEKGTTAAAVTGSELSAVSAPRSFKADRPFLFQIVDSETRTVLFSGRVNNPLDSMDSSDSADENPRCIGRKSKVEELLLDFVDFLAPNETETNLSNMTTRASRLHVLVGKYGNKTAGALEFIQTMDNTLDKLERTEEELRDVKEAHNIQDVRIQELVRERDGLETAKGQCWNWVFSQNRTINDLMKENGRLQTRIDQQVAQPNCPRENPVLSGNQKAGSFICLQRAEAQITVCNDHRCEFPQTLVYDSGRDGNCKTYNNRMKSVDLTGSCVTLYPYNSCSGTGFELNTRNSHVGREIERQFLFTNDRGQYFYRGPRSVSPCSQLYYV